MDFCRILLRFVTQKQVARFAMSSICLLYTSEYIGIRGVFRMKMAEVRRENPRKTKGEMCIRDRVWRCVSKHIRVVSRVSRSHTTSNRQVGINEQMLKF